MKGKKKLIVVIVLALLILGLFIVQANSFSFALAWNHLSLNKEMVLLDENIGMDGKIVRVVACTNKDGDPALVEMTKKYGFWTVTFIRDESVPYTSASGQEYDLPMLSLTWTNSTNHQYRYFFDPYADSQQADWTVQRHYYFYGINAPWPLEVPYEQLPPGVTMEIRQAEKQYFLHFIAYRDAPVGDVCQWLVDHGKTQW